jgi:hypothetical protein
MKQMADGSYAQAIFDVLKKLKIVSNHIRHISCVFCPGELQLIENKGDGTRNLGNWDPKIQKTA